MHKTLFDRCGGTALLIILFLSNSLGQTPNGVYDLGTNMESIKYYGSTFYYKDVFKQSQPWLTQETVWPQNWNTRQPIPLDSAGYPRYVPFYDSTGTTLQHVHKLMLRDIGDHYPSGNYTLLFDGSGTIEMRFAASGTYRSYQSLDNSFQVPVTASNGGIYMLLKQSDTADPVRNIRLFFPGFTEADAQQDPFHPRLYEILKPYEVIRFMDLGRTNNSELSKWADRCPPYWSTYDHPAGMPYEHMVDLCNRAGKDMWLCLPHRADDDFIRHLALLIRQKLLPERKLYLEYSNEVWNSIFTQYHEARDSAQAQFGVANYAAWYGHRAGTLHYIFDSVFAAAGRQYAVYNMMATQAANPWQMFNIMRYYQNPAFNSHAGQVQADIMSIAPYFGIRNLDSLHQYGLVSQTTPENVLQWAEKELYQRNRSNITASMAKAAEYNLPLWSYEGGQHLVAKSWAAINNSQLTQLLTETNAHPGMYYLYRDYLDQYYRLMEGGLLAHFVANSNWGRFGSWGASRYSTQSLAEAPKARALYELGYEHRLQEPLDRYRSDTLEYYKSEGGWAYFRPVGSPLRIRPWLGVQSAGLDSLSPNAQFVWHQLYSTRATRLQVERSSSTQKVQVGAEWLSFTVDTATFKDSLRLRWFHHYPHHEAFNSDSTDSNYYRCSSPLWLHLDTAITEVPALLRDRGVTGIYRGVKAGELTAYRGLFPMQELQLAPPCRDNVVVRLRSCLNENSMVQGQAAPRDGQLRFNPVRKKFEARRNGSWQDMH